MSNLNINDILNPEIGPHHEEVVPRPMTPGYSPLRDDSRDPLLSPIPPRPMFSPLNSPTHDLQNMSPQDNLPAKFQHVSGLHSRRNLPHTMTSGDLQQEDPTSMGSTRDFSNNLHLENSHHENGREISLSPSAGDSGFLRNPTSPQGSTSSDVPSVSRISRPSADELLSFRKDVDSATAAEVRVLSNVDKKVIENIVPLPKSARKDIAEEYKPEYYVINIPKVDTEWNTIVMFEWPDSAKVPDEPRALAKFNADFPGLAVELDLIEKHRQRQIEIAPIIRALNNVYKVFEITNSVDDEIEELLFDAKKGTTKALLDAIQLQCDHIAKITQARRENFLSLFEPLKPHIGFSRDTRNYCKAELREGLFGKTFINALRVKVAAIQEGLQSFTNAHIATKKMVPAMTMKQGSDPKKPRYVISYACRALAQLNLPFLTPLFPFVDISGVNYLSGMIKSFLPNRQLLTTHPHGS